MATNWPLVNGSVVVVMVEFFLLKYCCCSNRSFGKFRSGKVFCCTLRTLIVGGGGGVISDFWEKNHRFQFIMTPPPINEF